MNKYIITDNRCYESYLTIGEAVYVTERIDTGMVELLKTTKTRSDGKPLWIRGDMCTKDTHCIKDKAIQNLPHIKPQVENIIEIPYPSDNSHGIDLYRVQYISPLVNGSYELTMGWMESVKLTQEIYPRVKIMQQWKAVRNK